MDWNSILAPVLTAVATALAAVIGWAVTRAIAVMDEKIKASAIGRLGDATARAAGSLVTDAATLPDMMPTAAAVVAKAGQMATTMADTMKSLGGSQTDLEAMIRGELGKLLTKAPAPEAAAQVVMP